jgi:hypothetical protein
MNCIKCNIELTINNYSISAKNKKYYICNNCNAKRIAEYRIKKPWITKINNIIRYEHVIKHGWNIPKEIAYCLITSPCAYCGEIPNELNGLDRIDNNKGYTIDNVVPCCKNCNWAKNDLSINEFKKHIEKIYHYSKGVGFIIR